jgi:hypothetical protein
VTSPLRTLGFQLAAFVNIVGVLVFSKGFSNATLVSRSPIVFSRFGLLSIVLWGLAYLAVAQDHERVPRLVAVFAIEKLVYVGTWVAWIARFRGELPRLVSESPLTGTFYAIYGPTDLVFAVFFAAVALRNADGANEPKR